jgi:hypothetical protein
MFRGQDITIYGDPPTLVSPQLHVAIETADKRGKLGAQ